jgi:hypothetical protein
MTRSEYLEGVYARSDGKPKLACPYTGDSAGNDKHITARDRQESQLCKREWWLAGWHDRDMEMVL